MTTKPNCVCCHLREAHEAIDGECGVSGCDCEHYRPAFDWPDSAGVWFSRASGKMILLYGRTIRTWEGDEYGRHDWTAYYGPDQFTRCEPNPFEAKR